MEGAPNGVKRGSESRYFTPSCLARQMLLYQLYCGHFYCDGSYITRREDFGCFLLLYVASGKCCVKQPRRSFTAGAGELVFLNCHQPHEYGAAGPSEFFWLHFDGSAAAEFYDTVEKLHGELFNQGESAGMGAFLQENMAFFQGNHPEAAETANPMGEIAFSARLYQELCGLLACIPQTSPGEENAVNQAETTIRSHFSEPLSVEQLAGQAHMSTAYFSRLFKKKTGSSPYEYLIRFRISRAKYLLRSSDQSVEEIAFLAGFNSVSNFIYTFGKRTGMSPGKFRKMRF